MNYHYVWLIWSSAFLVPWVILFALNPRFRPVMLRTSCWTALLGITEPIFVPEYWDPPSLFELARRTGFDVESFIFSFAIGGIGVLLYHTFTRKDFAVVEPIERWQPLHRFHLHALLAPTHTRHEPLLEPARPAQHRVRGAACVAVRSGFGIRQCLPAGTA